MRKLHLVQHDPQQNCVFHRRRDGFRALYSKSPVTGTHIPADVCEHFEPPRHNKGNVLQRNRKQVLKYSTGWCDYILAGLLQRLTISSQQLPHLHGRRGLNRGSKIHAFLPAK